MVAVASLSLTERLNVTVSFKCRIEHVDFIFILTQVMQGFVLGETRLVKLCLDAKDLLSTLLAHLRQLPNLRLPRPANLLLALLYIQSLFFCLLDLLI